MYMLFGREYINLKRRINFEKRGINSEKCGINAEKRRIK